MSPKWGCNLYTKTFAIQRYQIEVTEIGRKFCGSVGGLLCFGIAER
jgi:hypothetical protein